MRVPDWYGLVLLTLAGFRLWRLVAVDVVTRKLREPILGMTEERHNRPAFSWPGYRPKLAEFVHCPWCLGAWCCIGWWGAWLVWPRGTLVASVPFAISAICGLVAKNLDP